MSFNLENSRIGHLPDAGWTADGGTTSPAVFPTGASLFVAGAIYDAASGPVTVSDGQFNTWIPLTEKVSLAGSGNIKARLWYVGNPVSISPNDTFTFNGTNGFIQGMVAAFTGSTNPPFDMENGNASVSGTTIQPGLVSPQDDNELVVAIAGYNVQAGTNFASVDSGFNILFNSTGVVGQRFPAIMAYKIQTNKNPENPLFTYPAVGAAVSTIATFRIPGDMQFSFGVDAKRV